jgi:hypothetical protein
MTLYNKIFQNIKIMIINNDKIVRNKNRMSRPDNYLENSRRKTNT